jgi:hypothetical protein
MDWSSAACVDGASALDEPHKTLSLTLRLCAMRSPTGKEAEKEHADAQRALLNPLRLFKKLRARRKAELQITKKHFVLQGAACACAIHCLLPAAICNAERPAGHTRVQRIVSALEARLVPLYFYRVFLTPAEQRPVERGIHFAPSHGPLPARRATPKPPKTRRERRPCQREKHVSETNRVLRASFAR